MSLQLVSSIFQAVVANQQTTARLWVTPDRQCYSHNNRVDFHCRPLQPKMFVQCAFLYSAFQSGFVFHNFGTVCHMQDIFPLPTHVFNYSTYSSLIHFFAVTLVAKRHKSPPSDCQFRTADIEIAHNFCKCLEAFVTLNLLH